MYSTLKAFANSFGVDYLEVNGDPGLPQPWGFTELSDPTLKAFANAI